MIVFDFLRFAQNEGVFFMHFDYIIVSSLLMYNEQQKNSIPSNGVMKQYDLDNSLAKNVVVFPEGISERHFRKYEYNHISGNHTLHTL